GPATQDPMAQALAQTLFGATVIPGLRGFLTANYQLRAGWRKTATSAGVIPRQIVDRDLARLRDELLLSARLEREGAGEQRVCEFQRHLDPEQEFCIIVKRT